MAGGGFGRRGLGEWLVAALARVIGPQDLGEKDG